MVRRTSPNFAVVLALIALGAACGSPTAPSSSDLNSGLPVETTTAHYVFHHADGDRIEAERQETYHAWVVERLGISLDRRIAYYKYRDRSHMHSVTGKVTNGWADPPQFAIHSIWPWDNHEVVHVMTALVGRPTDFFNEGIAVALSVDPQNGRWESMWQSQTSHAWCRSFRRDGELPRLSDIVETDAFRQLADTKSYPVAGSFMAFVIETSGMDRVKQFFRSGSRDARRAEVERQFEAACGLTLQQAETRWHSYLDGR